MHFRQPTFTYSGCGIFTENKERIPKFKETGYVIYIYQEELDKVWFQHDIGNGNFEDLYRRTAFDKSLCNKAWNIAKNAKYGEY